MSEDRFRKRISALLNTIIGALIIIAASAFILVYQNSIQIENNTKDIDENRSLIHKKMDCTSYESDRQFLIEKLNIIESDIKQLLKDAN